MKHRITMGTLAAIFLIQGIALAVPVEVYSATVSSGTVKASSCFVRSSAGTGSAVSFCLSSGDELAILGEEKAKDGSTWFKVAIGTSVGYIRSDLVSKTGKKVNVSDSLLGRGKGTTTATETPAASATPAAQSTPAAAETPAATDGPKLTSAAATTGSGTGVVTGTYVRMRSTASTTSGIVAYLDAGTTVTILAEGKAADGYKWYQIKNGDQTGFVRGDLISRKTADTPSPAAEPEKPTTQENSAEQTKTVEPGTGLVKGANVNIRSTAGEAGDVVGTVSSGCELKLLGLERSGDKDWIKISTAQQGQEINGYILRDYVMVTKAVKVVTRTTTIETLIGCDVAAGEETKPKTVSENTGPASPSDG